MFCRPRESTRPGSSWKALGSVCTMLNSRLLVAFKSLYPHSEVCVRVGGVKSQLSTVGVGFRQVGVLSPLLFIVDVNWILTGTAETTRVPLLEAAGSTLWLLRTIWCCKQDLDMHLVDLQLRAIKQEWKLALKHSKDRGIMSLKKPTAVDAAVCRYTGASQDVQLHGCGIHEWWKAEKIWFTDW